MMEQIDQLMTIAEISVVLAGFAGIISTFQNRNSRGVSRGQVISLSMIVNISLMAAFFAVLPVGMFNFGMGEAAVWSATSFLIGLNQMVFIIFIARNSELGTIPWPIRLIYISLYVTGVLVGIADLLNAFAIVFDGGIGMVFVTFVFNLGVVCLHFSRLLLVPLWREVRQRERQEDASDPEHDA